MALPLALYYMANRDAANRAASALPETPPERPQGPLVWLHVSRAEDTVVAQDLIARLLDRDPALWFLVTTVAETGDDWPVQCLTVPLPAEAHVPAMRFVTGWTPDVVVWLGGELRPGLIGEAAGAGVPLYLFDTGNAVAAAQYKSRIPGLRRFLLRAFTGLFAGDAITARAFQRAGANVSNIRTIGVLERGIQALHCLEAERDTLAELLVARPIWLAADLHPDEYDLILSAHAALLRRTHRLLLILVPADPADGDKVAQALIERDMLFQQRSTGAEPDAETQVYLADTDSELGLWYRLAPSSVIGHSFVDSGSAGPHPFHAASLGSAVIHGPETGNHRDAYHRLQRAEASREVSGREELVAAVDALLSPDRAAEMAHSAWTVCSAGAEVTEAVIDTILEAVAARQVPT